MLSSLPRGALPTASRARLALLAAAALLGTVLYTWRTGTPSSENLTVVTGVLGAAACLYAAARTARAARWAWGSFAGALLLYAAADVLWLAFGGAEGDPPVLSVADALYLLALVPATVGLLLYPVTTGGLRAWGDQLGPLLYDVAVLGSAGLLACDVLVFGEVARLGGSPLDVATYLVYPVTDVLLVCLVLALLLRSQGDPRPDVVLIGLCFAAYTFADNGYALLSVRGVDTIGTVVDLAFILAPVLLGAGAIVAVARHGAVRTVQRHTTGIVTPVLPDLTAAVALALFVILGRGSGWSGSLLAGITLALAGLRQVAITADRHRLRRRLEERVARRTEELRLLTAEYQRLEAMKHGFVASVSHELRTPLTSVHGSLELLADGDAGALTPAATEVVGRALRGTRRLSRLVDDIIDLERLQHGSFPLHPRAQPLAPLIADAVDAVSVAAALGGVRLVQGPAQEHVVVDGDRVVQAVVNLLGNAVKFTPAGGTVSVTTSATAGEVVVVVSDQGVGASRPTSWGPSSSASTRSSPATTAVTAGRVSGWRSPATSSRPTVAGSGWRAPSAPGRPSASPSPGRTPPATRRTRTRGSGGRRRTAARPRRRSPGPRTAARSPGPRGSRRRRPGSASPSGRRRGGGRRTARAW